jgi:hypothetical protein
MCDYYELERENTVELEARVVQVEEVRSGRDWLDAALLLRCEERLAAL